jgi:hypothetical protein
MKFCIVVVCISRKVYNQVTKWLSDQWPSDQLYPVVIVMKFCIVVLCTPKKVYGQVTKSPSDQVTNWPSHQWRRWWTISSKQQFEMENSKEMMYCCHAFQWFRQIWRSSLNVYNFLCDSLLQWPSTKHNDIALSVWTKFGKSMLLTWTTVCGLLTRWKTFRFIQVGTHQKNKKYCIFKSTSINTIKTK